METIRISVRGGTDITDSGAVGASTTNTAAVGTATTNQQSGSKLQVGLPFRDSKNPTGAYTGTGIYQQYMTDLYGFSIQLGSSLAVVMIIYAGYKYLTSQGNQTALNDAKEILIGALLGLAILLLVRVILNALKLPTLGV